MSYFSSVAMAFTQSPARIEEGSMLRPPSGIHPETSVLTVNAPGSPALPAYTDLWNGVRFGIPAALILGGLLGAGAMHLSMRKKRR